MRLNEKTILFLIATFTTFFGITNNLLKGTEASEILQEDIVMNEEYSFLTDIIINNNVFHFEPNSYNYNLKVDDFDSLSIIPILSNNSNNYTIDIIGDISLDNNLIAIINVNSQNNDNIYTLFIEKILK